MLDLNTNQLTLITGEQFRLDRRNSDFFPNGLMVFHDQKLRSFVVRQIGVDGRVFRVEHKSGDTEWLEVRERSGVAMVVQMRSPHGRQAFFEWLSRGDNQFQLGSIWDERGPQQPLLRVVLNRDGAEFDFHPGTSSESKIILQQTNGMLSNVILPDGDSRWTFDYMTDRDSGLLFPNKVFGPLGSEDTVQYATGNQGHILPPGAPLTSLPRITNLRHSPGAGQPEIYRSYTYIGTSNFLGGDVAPPGGWQDGTDNLYRRDSYEYTSIETVQNAKGETLATGERTWNRFHLQTKEVLTRHSTRLQNGITVAQNRTVTKETIYGDDPGKGWEDQPAWCQLPVATITQFDDAEQAPRKFREETDYDDYGNVLQKRYADGRVETLVYYPPGGGEGCPDDGSPFVRWLKSQTLNPATPAGGARTVETRQTYALLPKRKADDVQVLVAVEEIALAIDGPAPELIGTTRQTWNLNPTSAFFGQPLQSVSTLNGFATTTDFQRSVDVAGVGETVTHTGHDGLSTSTRNLRNARNGLTLSEHNVNGLETVHTYDHLGRIVSQKASVGTPYAVTKTYAYNLADSQRQRAVVVEETDFTGQKLRRYLDGDGRIVRETRQDVDITGDAFREIWSGIYDHDGKLAEETAQDWSPGNPAPTRLTTTRELDAWGEVSVQHQPDGSSSHTFYDPIKLISRHWTQSRTGERSAETEVLRNEAGEVEKVTLYAPRMADGKPGAVVRVESWTFDGLNRPITHSVVADGLTTLTRTERDVFGRTIAVTREDNSVVRWSYAAQSDGEDPEKVTLTPSGGEERVLAEVTYDGLGRPVTQQSSGQVERLNYLKGQILPESSVLPDGHVTRMSYIRALDEAPLSVSPDNEIANTYSYSTPNGYLTEITGELGRINFEYTASGRLVKEHWTLGNETYTSVSTETLLSRPLSFTDVGGTQHQVEYDSLGRVALQLSGVITVKPDYDAFGRVEQITTTDTTNGSSLTQTLAYDAMGRELSRTWENIGNGLRHKTVQTLGFNSRDKVISRCWEQDGHLQSKETYTYDARGRLTQTDASGPKSPLDGRTGKRISQQKFTLNALDGYETVETVFADGTGSVMTFTYDAVAPDRPVKISHRGVQDVDIALVWDAAGRLLEERRDDVLYRQFEWRADGLVRRVTGMGTRSDYRYDPQGRVGEQQTDAGTTRRFYNGAQVINERGAEGSLLTLVRSASGVFAESLLSQSIRTVRLTGSDGQGSVRLESDHETRLVSYTAHGNDDGTAQSRVGYAGELRDLESDLYFPGSYRPYDPVLMLFLAPDSASPLGAGGLNRYAYCGGDPVNRVDPDGHSFWSWVGAAVGLVLGGIAIVASAGTLTPVVAPIMASITSGTITSAMLGAVAAATSVSFIATAAAVTLTAVSIATGLATPILELTNNKQAAKITGYVSGGTGVATTVVSAIPGVVRIVEKVGKFVGRWQYMLQHSTGGRRLPARVLTVDPSNPQFGPGLVNNYQGGGAGSFLISTSGTPGGRFASMVTRSLVSPAQAADELLPLMAYVPADAQVTLVASGVTSTLAVQAFADALGRNLNAFFGRNVIFQLNNPRLNQPFSENLFNYPLRNSRSMVARILRRMGLGNTAITRRPARGMRIEAATNSRPLDLPVWNTPVDFPPSYGEVTLPSYSEALRLPPLYTP
ncbi:hypothetical protein BK667_11725 [Pseudomonas frederiksbergensis]|nr:hypothetical protein BK667_11725 [Pseudomonas frederiksbergensis]